MERFDKSKLFRKLITTPLHSGIYLLSMYVYLYEYEVSIHTHRCFPRMNDTNPAFWVSFVVSKVIFLNIFHIF